MTDNEAGLQKAFGRAVRSVRDDLQLTQQKFGGRAGLHRNYVGAVERGEINPTLKIIGKCARGAAVEPSLLFQIAEEIQRTGQVPARKLSASRNHEALPAGE